MGRAATETESVPTGVFGAEVHRDEESGRFLIEGRSSSTIIPPVGSSADEELEPLSSALLESVALEPRPRTLPPPVPAAALSRPPVAPTDDTLDLKSALEPYYRGLPLSDRAELQVDDLSLDLSNPYMRSSLTPPPRKAVPVTRWLLGLAVTGAALAAGAMLTHPWEPGSARIERAASVSPAAVVQPVAAPVAPVASAPQPVVKLARVEVVAPSEPAPAAAAAPTSLPAQPIARALPASREAHEAATQAEPQTEAVQAPAIAHAPRVQPTEAVAVDHAEQVAAPAAPAVNDAQVEAAAATDAPAVAEETLPETPSREDIMAGFEGIRADVQACAADAHGTSLAKVTLSGAGRVTYAIVEGAFAGTPAGSCIARTLRKATFPRFASAALKVSYPFVL